MKIGILIVGHPPQELSHNGRYDAYFIRLLDDADFTYQAWSVLDGEMPADVHDAQGWLITGSRHGAYEPHPWIPPLEQFIRDCYAAHVPMIGVCFGHQIIAQAMGGKVEKFAGGWSVGRVWSIQPHPEYESDFIEGLITHRGKGLVPDAQLAAAASVLDQPLDNHAIGAKMAAFFKKERA